MSARQQLGRVALSLTRVLAGVTRHLQLITCRDTGYHVRVYTQYYIDSTADAPTPRQLWGSLDNQTVVVRVSPQQQQQQLCKADSLWCVLCCISLSCSVLKAAATVVVKGFFQFHQRLQVAAEFFPLRYIL